MRRFGRVLKLRDGKEAEYERLHAAVWPEVLDAIARSGIRNYSIFRHGHWLFAYFELPEGADVALTERVFAESEPCCRWETLMQALQEPLPESGAADWWVAMPEVFHTDGASA